MQGIFIQDLTKKYPPLLVFQDAYALENCFYWCFGCLGSFHAHLTRGFNHFVATQFQGVSEAAKRFCSADLQPASGIIAKLIAEERKVQLFASDLSTFELARLHGEKRC